MYLPRPAPPACKSTKRKIEIHGELLPAFLRTVYTLHIPAGEWGLLRSLIKTPGCLVLPRVENYAFAA